VTAFLHTFEPEADRAITRNLYTITGNLARIHRRISGPLGLS
jgi:hypothetical protein